MIEANPHRRKKSAAAPGYSLRSFTCDGALVTQNEQVGVPVETRQEPSPIPLLNLLVSGRGIEEEKKEPGRVIAEWVRCRVRCHDTTRLPPSTDSRSQASLTSLDLLAGHPVASRTRCRWRGRGEVPLAGGGPRTRSGSMQTSEPK